MTTALTLILLGPLVLLWMFVLVLAVQALANLLPARPDARGPECTSGAGKFVILMPAHNEEAIIEDTVRHTLSKLGPTGRLLVIADNCTDSTARRARAAGAEVTERHDPHHRGKGYALAHGVDQLRLAPPAVVVVLDADCHAEDGAVDRLVNRALHADRPVQGRYDMLPPESAGLKQRMAAFAWDFRSRFRSEGFRRLGLPCQLMGSGMAFPWASLEKVSLANGHLVEDLKLGLDLASAGLAPVHGFDAVVTSVFPANEQGARSQRQRWEHGHLSMMVGTAPRLLWKAVTKRDPALLAMVVDMSVPPLALLVLALAGFLAVVTALFGLGWIPAWLVMSGATATAATGIIVLTGWWRVGRRWIRAGELCTIPLYVLAKVPVYAAFLTRRQLQWIRTRRD